MSPTVEDHLCTLLDSVLSTLLPFPVSFTAVVANKEFLGLVVFSQGQNQERRNIMFILRV